MIDPVCTYEFSKFLEDEAMVMALKRMRERKVSQAIWKCEECDFWHVRDSPIFNQIPPFDSSASATSSSAPPSF